MERSSSTQTLSRPCRRKLKRRFFFSVDAQMHDASPVSPCHALLVASPLLLCTWNTRAAPFFSFAPVHLASLQQQKETKKNA